MGRTITDREARTTPVEKDPTADVPYTFDWTDYLEDGETIATASIDVDEIDPAGTTITVEDGSPLVSGAVVTCWARPTGTEDVTFRIRCTVTTSTDRTDVRSLLVRLRDL